MGQIPTSEYRIELKGETEPYSLKPPRRVAVYLLPKVKRNLKEMEDTGVISKVKHATDGAHGT